MRAATVVTLLGLAVCVLPASCLHKAPRFRIDLETPPEERWDHVIRQFGVEKFREIAVNILDTLVPEYLVPTLNLLVSPLDEFLPAPYASEIKGIAKTTSLGLGDITGLNLIYDITAYCTSIVAEDTQGVIWHGRNLDYSRITHGAENLTAVIDFYRHGQVEYTTTSFLGQVGAFTGMKPHAFTISLNERDQGSFEKNMESLLEALLLKKGTLTSFILRDAIATKRDYREAVEEISSTRLVAPAYFTVGGVGPEEGVVITRDQDHADLWPLDARNGRWWLLETNYDHWTTPPPDDDRRDPGNAAMRRVGRDHINDRTLFEVLSVKPVLNNITAYTHVMCAAKPELYNTEIRDGN